jgi:hypothetical protein
VRRCEVHPAKRRYRTGVEALQAAHRLKRNGRELFAYECNCGGFHLTSQDPKTIGMKWRAS